MIKRLIESLPTNNRIERIWKLAQVEFQRRYYNDSLGLFWALIKPLFEVGLYYVVFTTFFPVEIPNYAIYLFGGIVFWMTFAEATTRSLHLLQDKLYLIDNIQFNHFDIYLAHILSISFAFAFNYFAFIIMALSFGAPISIHFIPLIIALITLLVLCLGTSLIISSIQPFFKDINHLWDMLILVGFWTSGILYESERIFDGANWFAHVNPMVGLIYTGRASFLENVTMINYWLFYPFVYSVIVLLIGIWTFKKLGPRAIEKL